MAACEKPFDIVITINSGDPLDSNLYQAVKGVSAAQKNVRKGGAIFVFGGMQRRFAGSRQFRENVADAPHASGNSRKIEDESFQMFDQWQVQKQALVQWRADIYVYSR